MKTSTLKIAFVAIAIACMATPSFAQRGGRGGGGGGGGGQRGGGGGQGQGQGGGQGGGQRSGGGNPGGQHQHGNPGVGAGVNAGAGAAAQPQHPHHNNPGAINGGAGINANGNLNGGNAAVRAQINGGANPTNVDRNGPNRGAFNNNGQPNVGQFNRNDPRFNNPQFRNDPRFNGNNLNNNPQRTFANGNNPQNFHHYDPAANQVRINNRTVNYGNPNYRPSYSRYSWYNGYQAGPYGAGGAGYGLGGYGNGSAYGVGYRGGFGNNVGSTLLGLGLSSLTGGGYGYGGGLGGIGGIGGLGGGYGSGLGYPAGWGLGGWGLGSMGYNSGYLAYNNPYYSGNTGGNYAYNYAQPIPVAIAGQATDNDVATQNFETARQQFKDGEYSAALASVDSAIKLQPTDAVMHEFRALTQFALGDYRNSAATIHSVLAVGPGWNWETLISLYPNVETYTTQLRALEQAVTQSPKQADTRFLLGYQYMTEGHAPDASKQFQIAADLMPQDQVAKDLSRLNNADQSAQAAAPAAAAAPSTTANATAPAPVAIDPEKLVGDWKAERPDGSKFDVDFSPDKTFTWKFAQADKNQTLTGTYGIENDMLVLQSKEGGAMLGHVSLNSDNKFTFKLLGTPESDQGLAFNR